MEPRIRTIDEIGSEDRARACEHEIHCALMAQYIVKQQLKIKKLKEKNERSKQRRVEEKSPIITCITNYVCERAKLNVPTMVISLEHVSQMLADKIHCTCSICEYVRSMKSAAAGAGHFLKGTHTVTFSPYDKTITLKAA